MKTVLQHFKLWRQVLTKDRDMTFISRDLSIENLEEPLYPFPLNMALPELYLNPPPRLDPEEDAETAESASGTLLNELVNSENGASFSSEKFEISKLFRNRADRNRNPDRSVRQSRRPVLRENH